MILPPRSEVFRRLKARSLELQGKMYALTQSYAESGCTAGWQPIGIVTAKSCRHTSDTEAIRAATIDLMKVAQETGAACVFNVRFETGQEDLYRHPGFWCRATGDAYGCKPSH